MAKKTTPKPSAAVVAAAKRNPKLAAALKDAKKTGRKWYGSAEHNEAQRRAGRSMAAAAIMMTPGAKVASTVGKAVTRVAAKKYTPKVGQKVSKTFVQGRNATVKQTPPKRTGAGPNSPVKGTKVDLETKTRGRSPREQASSKEGRRTRNVVQKLDLITKAGAGTAYVMDPRNRPKSTKKRSK